MWQTRQRWLQPLITDITPVWDFPQPVPSAPDMAEACKWENYYRTIWAPLPAAFAVGSSSRMPACFVFLVILEYSRPLWLQNCALAHCHGGDGWDTPGVCLTTSECSGHGRLLTHGILQWVKFKQDLSRPWHPQKGRAYVPCSDCLALPRHLSETWEVKVGRRLENCRAALLEGIKATLRHSWQSG